MQHPWYRTAGRRATGFAGARADDPAARPARRPRLTGPDGAA
ncbi:MAG TPA: hypothetical protein VGQ83_42245 [Polyangia bacterium]